MRDSTVMGTKSGTLGMIKKCLLFCILISTDHSLNSVIVYKVVHKKKSVSCAAGGRNYGQSGGRISFFFFTFIFL